MEININIYNEYKYTDLYKEYKLVKEELDYLLENKQDYCEHNYYRYLLECSNRLRNIKKEIILKTFQDDLDSIVDGTSIDED